MTIPLETLWKRRFHYRIAATCPSTSRTDTGPLDAVDLRYTVTATSYAHALATFWRKYAQRKFAIDRQFKNEQFRRDFPLIAKLTFIQTNLA